MKRLSLLTLVAVFGIACSKDEPVSTPFTPVDQLSELTVDESFNWSSSSKGTIEVSISSDTNVFEFTNSELQIVDESGNVLDRQLVENNKATFYYMTPQNGDKLYVNYPNLGVKKEITGQSQMTFTAENLFTADYSTLLANANASNGKKASGKVMADLVINGDFESNSNFQTIPNSLATGKWYVKKKDKNSYYRRTNISGSTRFKSESNSKGYAYQLLDVNGGDLFTTTANTSGDFCTFLFFYDANGYYIGYAGYAPGNNDNISGSGTIPSTAAQVLIKIHGDDGEWIDNVTFDVQPAIQDADNDGVADNDDAYPNDPTRAYNSSFPTTGYQTLAFEDLWPFQGDYDFNDMIVSNQVQWVRNANNELVEGIFTLSLDAVGSGFANGVAVVLLDANKNPIAQNMIASVSGDATLDANVTNGLVVFNDVYAAQSTYYQNNGVGPDAPADIFTYTITFNNNAGTQNLLPDTYIYRTSDRGLEVHVDGFSGTTAANTSYFNTGVDVSGTYNTANGLPWAIEIVTANKDFNHPNEKVDITQAYPDFALWAQSNGTQALDWKDNLVTNLIFLLL
jgi:LruC domain-containing protein